MTFAGQWLKNGSFFVRRNSVILELGSDPTHSKAHNHGNFPHIGILSSPTRLLGRRRRRMIATGNDLLKRRPSMSLDRRGGEYEALQRDLTTWPAHRRIDRRHNRYR